MPIYEFTCLDCDNGFERIQAFSDKSLPVCPHCHSHRVQRRLSSPAIHFKGSGWYITDSKNASKTGANGKSTTDKGESAAADSAKGEAEKSESPKTSKSESTATAAAPASTSNVAKSD